MRRHMGVWGIALAMTASLTAAVAPAALSSPAPTPGVHPRLLFSRADMPGLRARVSAGGVPQAAWTRLQERAEGHLAKVSPDVVRANVGKPATLQGLEKPYTLQNEMPTYLIDLGMAYQLSGDDRFGRRAIDLLIALGDAGYPYWQPQDLGVGDLLEGIGLAFDWTYQLMSPAERTTIVGQLASHDKQLMDRMLVHPTHPAARYPTSNWMGVTAGGAGLTALALLGEPGAPPQTARYVDRAAELVRTFFLASTDQSGAYNEGHQYALYGMKNSVPFALALKRAGGADLIAGTGLPKMARWQASEQLPGDGQNFAPLNDSGRSQYGVDMASLHFAIDPGNGVAQWLWQHTVGPKGNDFYREPHVPDYALEGKCTQVRVTEAPASTAACPIFNGHGNVLAILFYRTPSETPEVDPASAGPLTVWHADRGLVDARTGYAKGADEVFSTFEAHRNGIAHFQYDVGNFTIYGKGGRFAVDPGTSCVACGNNSDMGYAIGHNVILVDAKRDTQYRFLRYFTGDTVTSVVDAPTSTLTHADVRYAYNFEPPVAERDHFFGRSPARPVIVAIGDSLQRDKIPFEKANPNDHTYTWQMLTNWANRVDVAGAAFTVTAPNGAAMVGRAAVDGAAAADPTFSTRFYNYDQTSDDLPGAHVLSTVTPPSQAFDQLTVMAVTAAGQPAATIETLRVNGGNAVAVTWNGGTDVVVRRLARARAVTGIIDTDGDMAKLTRGAGDTVLRNGTRLTAYGVELVSVRGAPATVTVSGGTVTATGAARNVYRVFAPQPVATVTADGRPVRSCREGQYLTFPCTRR